MHKLMPAVALAAAALVAGAPGAWAVTNLVTNGEFNSFTSAHAADYQLASPQTTGSASVLTSWANFGYTFDYTAGANPVATCAEAACGRTLSLWNSTNGGVSSSTSGVVTGTNTTFTAVPGGAGSNFLAVDPVYQIQSPDLTQTLSGLTVGGLYDLTFYYAGAQQTGFNGATTEGWTGRFGSSAFTTATISDAAHGFTPWVQATFAFVATSASEVLSFTATGGPSSGDPPFALLADVSLTYAPEPATWAVMMAGLGGLGLAGRLLRRRRGTPGVTA